MESWIKVVLAACVAILFVAVKRVAGRLKARPGGTVNQMENEIPALRVLRPLLAIGFYGGLLDWVVPGTRLPWSYHAGPAYLRGAGGCASVVSVLVLWWSFETLGKHYRGGVGLWEDHALVTSGPYRVVQHPIYASFVLLMLGLWGMSGNWLMGGTGVLLTAAIPALRLGTEERELRERFGTEHSGWAKSTKRFIPYVF